MKYNLVCKKEEGLFMIFFFTHRRQNASTMMFCAIFLHPPHRQEISETVFSAGLGNGVVESRYFNWRQLVSVDKMRQWEQLNANVDMDYVDKEHLQDPQLQLLPARTNHPEAWFGSQPDTVLGILPITLHHQLATYNADKASYLQHGRPGVSLFGPHMHA